MPTVIDKARYEARAMRTLGIFYILCDFHGPRPTHSIHHRALAHSKAVAYWRASAGYGAMLEHFDTVMRIRDSKLLIGLCPGPPGAFKRPVALSIVIRFCMAFLYGRAGRLTDLLGGFRPGQCA